MNKSSAALAEILVSADWAKEGNKDNTMSIKNRKGPIISQHTHLEDSLLLSGDQEKPLHETDTVQSYKVKAPRTGKFVALQNWEGVVLEVFDKYFLARLIDTTENSLDEEAEFSVTEISEADKELLVPGAIFYWSIGYHDSPSGQRTRTSIIRFRRLPYLSERDIQKAEEVAREIGELIGWK